MPSLRSLLLFVALLALAACDSAETPIPDPVPADSVVAGVNLNALLAEPTPDEVEAAAADFAVRAQSVVPEDVEIETSFGDGDATVQIVSFTSPAPEGTGRLYGAVRIPDVPPGSQTRLPILVVIPEGEGDVSTADFLTEGPSTALGEDFLQVLLAPPGGSLHAGDTGYESTPLPDAFATLYDYEVDLTRALLKAALDEHADIVDPERIGYVGFGRGGSVALLLATRPGTLAYPFEPTVIAALAPFTDYAVPSFRAVVHQLLRDVESPFPGSADLATRYLIPLRERDLPMEDVREALLRRSPIYFADALPPVFLRFSESDLVIGSDHSTRLIEEIRDRLTFTIAFDLSHEALFTDENVRRTLTTYLLDRLGE